MAIQLQTQQKIGFAIGADATAPEYILETRQFNADPSHVYQEVKAVVGDRDNLYHKELVGYESLPLPNTLPFDTRICPILLALAGKVTTTGSSPSFVNNITRYNDESGGPSAEGNRLTFFFYDGANGLIKQKNKIVNEVTLTIENNQINMEVDFLGGEQEVLTGADKTTAEAGFVITNQAEADLASFPATGVDGTVYTATDTKKHYMWNGTEYFEVGDKLGYGLLFKPGGLVVRYDDDLAFANPTIVNAEFGCSITINNDVQELPRTLSATNELVSPISYLGQFMAGFDFTAEVQTDDLFNRHLNSTDTAFEFKFTRGSNVVTFTFAPTAIPYVTGDKVADSSDAVKQTVSLEQAKNNITDQSLAITANLAIDLNTIINP